ncbi:lysylphosphatidylglycerol synthase transmembrane domain-containing protein [Conexibacter sp. JD483]|uniref:lysylphosphatidylglycerol synthase transmembrane domain-containing protein n=1 Tax=unclassified Conexibacter TaxID=2627773 RepID=UPI00271D0E5F|nr:MULTISPECIES: lysylphosphatidylglycerol synthase transmembrane domain-containing protein [unclassified Conexibacter]MDO8186198.1 lysylphosphatidylglycerol synthase transmembrane domain-containing protein [Conexibacter sp. CPCC 205706]MDO8199735.1 lysylphosphatidylglycerol synthase transmembrane domain-containing protein [Conexibacter sp. CPCC 205762]MDR9368173.1 lysylphosphatidylglycerol synthase transmembrane domain-containing protein [Conexibacter sp. JD483]
MTPARKRILLGALWLVPIVGIVWWATKQEAPTFPDSTGGWLALAGGLGLYTVATLMRAERWERILRRADVRAKRADVYALTPIGYMGNNVLPARGGELLRTFLLGARVEGTTKRTILGTILAERVLDAVALGIILVVLASDLLGDLPKPSGTLLLAGAGVVVLLLVGAAVALLKFRERLMFVLESLLPMLAPVKQLLSGTGAVLLVVSLLIWVVEASVYKMVGHALHIELSIRDGLAVVAFTNAASLIPAAPGYIGTYDAAVIFAVNAVTNAPRSAVLSYLILLRFVLFVPITVVGFVLLVVRYGGLSRVRAARDAARDEERTEHEAAAAARAETHVDAAAQTA